MNALGIVGSLFVLLAVLIHLGIFLLESILWSRPGTWRRFGLRTQDAADTVRPMAFNQGFYNVFLAIGASVGLIMLGAGQPGALPLVIFASACMLGAGVVLAVSAPRLWRAALIQGLPPLAGIVLLLLAA